MLKVETGTIVLVMTTAVQTASTMRNNMMHAAQTLGPALNALQQLSN